MQTRTSAYDAAATPRSALSLTGLEVLVFAALLAFNSLSGHALGEKREAVAMTGQALSALHAAIPDDRSPE